MTSSGTMFIPSFMKVGQLMQMFKLKTYTDSVAIYLLSSVRKGSIDNYMYNNVRELFDSSIISS
jgi:hypothetical protein